VRSKILEGLSRPATLKRKRRLVLRDLGGVVRIQFGRRCGLEPVTPTCKGVALDLRAHGGARIHVFYKETAPGPELSALIKCIRVLECDYSGPFPDHWSLARITRDRSGPYVHFVFAPFERRYAATSSCFLSTA
jgi:hypothetical protein